MWRPLLGRALMALYTTGLADVLGYAVLRSGSVLLFTYLHALNNQVPAFIAAIGFRPFAPAWSFFIRRRAGRQLAWSAASA